VCAASVLLGGRTATVLTSAICASFDLNRLHLSHGDFSLIWFSGWLLQGEIRS
jgi:hypothetical protein